MRTRRSFYFLGVVLLPFLVLLQNPSITEPIRGFSFAVLKPALQIGRTIQDGFANTQRGWERFWKAFREYEQNEARIAQLESKILYYQELDKENERLHKLLEFRQSVADKNVAARVIGWDTSPWRKTLVLDKGTEQGIQKGMAVVSAEGLVGRISQVGPATARVLLLLDPDSRVSAITSETRIQGVAAGDGSQSLTVKYIDLDSNVSVGENILSSGLGGLYPKGLRIGQIVSLGRDETGLHLAAKLEPFVNFSKLEEVLCLVSSPEKSS